MQHSDKQKRLRIFFTGVGGQGTLTATTLLARTALDAGQEVVAGEVHGMAQRGGVVESVLLLGGWRSPKLDLGEADILLGFEPLETLRGLPYLRPGGVIFSSRDPMPPLSVSLGMAAYPSMEEIEQKSRAV
ncbi:MAG: 2-oxoacid:acceptor oxidoreductase family protein, partial [Desulfovibrio sp.]